MNSTELEYYRRQQELCEKYGIKDTQDSIAETLITFSVMFKDLDIDKMFDMPYSRLELYAKKIKERSAGGKYPGMDEMM
uniref:Uncharacterized protein n=1 Tax=viral metagenome TaxID=1070528 RepID=A0A6M3IJM6_9ZZZZ